MVGIELFTKEGMVKEYRLGILYKDGTIRVLLDESYKTSEEAVKAKEEIENNARVPIKGLLAIVVG